MFFLKQLFFSYHFRILQYQIFIATSKIELPTTFRELVYQINKVEPSEAFAKQYIQEGINFFDKIEVYRAKDLADA